MKKCFLAILTVLLFLSGCTSQTSQDGSQTSAASGDVLPTTNSPTSQNTVSTAGLSTTAQSTNKTPSSNASETPGAITNSPVYKSELNISPDAMTFYADVAHEGNVETILVDISGLQVSGYDSAVVYVFDSNEKLLWKDEASLIHAGNNGIYLYKENNIAYLMEWKPYVGQSVAHLSYQIFSLSRSGDIITYKEGEGQFNLDPAMNPGPDGRTAEANVFVDNVNKYLEKSTVLVVTDTEKATYSTPDNLITLTAPHFTDEN